MEYDPVSTCPAIKLLLDVTQHPLRMCLLEEPITEELRDDQLCHRVCAIVPILDRNVTSNREVKFLPLLSTLVDYISRRAGRNVVCLKIHTIYINILTD